MKVLHCFVCGYFLTLLLLETVSKETVYFSKAVTVGIKNDTELYIFDFRLNVNVQECISSCKLRKKCRFVNYWNSGVACFYVGARAVNVRNLTDPLADIWVEEKPEYVYSNKTEWNKTDICNNCSDNGVCDKCESSACEPPATMPNAFFLGNMYSVGSKVKYECYNNLHKTVSTTDIAVCQENGTWSKTQFDCGCGSSVTKQRTQTIENKNDSTVKLHCTNNLLKYVLTPVCQENGMWNDTSFVCTSGPVTTCSNSACYYLDTGYRTWQEANDTCSSYGGHLVEINNRAEDDFLSDWLQTAYSTCYSSLAGNYSVDGNQFKASSIWDSDPKAFGPYRSWLNTKENLYLNGTACPECSGAWTPETKHGNDHNKTQYIEVNLKYPSDIRGIATKGRDNSKDNQYVTAYNVTCSSDFVNFTNITQGGNQTFNGNTDKTTLHTNNLTDVLCGSIRILPQTWHEQPSLRFDLFGCPANTSRVWIGNCTQTTCSTNLNLGLDSGNQYCVQKDFQSQHEQSVPNCTFLQWSVCEYPPAA